MKEENFKKGLEDLNRDKLSMTSEEEVMMLSKIFSTPLESPYVGKISVFGFALTRRLQFAFIASFIFLLSTSSVVYASGDSLPGDLLYPVKVSIVEPVLDVVNSGRGRGVDWAEEKVIRRIKEAEKLAEQNKLTDDQVEIIEKRIKKDSGAFAEVLKKDDKPDLSKIEEFEKRVNEGKGKKEGDPFKLDKPNNSGNGNNNRSDQVEKVRKLKDTAIRSLNSNNGKGNNGNKGKNK